MGALSCRKGVDAEILSPWKAFSNAAVPLDLMASVLAADRGLSGDCRTAGASIS